MREAAGSGALDDGNATDRQFLVDVGGHYVPWSQGRLYLNIRNVANTAYLVSRRPAGARPNAPRQLQAGLKQGF